MSQKRPDHLSDYVEVSERIDAFHRSFPEGSLQGDYTVRELGEQTVIVYRAKAYRTPDDQRPGIGFASEPVPGRTPYTKGSELMNAETSAWGRALAALGFEVRRGVASKQEVAAQRNGHKLERKRVEAIIARFHDAGMKYREIGVALGAAGIDGLRANSAKAVSERISGLSGEQADALEAVLDGP